MNKPKGLRIGHYLISPLGIGAFSAIIVIIIAVILLLVLSPAPADDGSKITVNDMPAETAAEDAAIVQATPVITPEPTATPAPELRTATIRALGEIAIQDNLLKAAKTEDGSYDFSGMFSEIAPVMGDADYTIADVEGSLGGTVDAKGDSLLITPPSIIDALSECGVDMLNMANDHALDGLYGDLVAALENCGAAGMEYVGAAASQEEKDTPKVIDINGIKVGFVAYTESLNGREKKSDTAAVKYGVNLISKNTNPAADIKACRSAGADIVVACMSWGKMLERSATESELACAKVLVQAGADVIIGYNPHVIQPVKWLEVGGKRALCLFSCGNFLSDVRSKYADSGVIFQFTIQEKADYSGFEIADPIYIPTYVWRSENEDGSYDYRTMAVGNNLESQPEGMDYTQYTRMKAVWAEAQGILGTDAATVSAQ